MTVRLAINGFGRVGRSVLRAAHEQHADVEVVAVNDLVDPATLAHLLKYDSVYGRFPGHVAAGDGAIVIDGVAIRTLAETDPLALPWEELGVDVVIESTGRLRTRAGAAQHLEAGARKVIISAPAKGTEPPGRDARAGRELRRGLRPRERTTSSRTPRARPTASHRSRWCCTTRSASSTGR